MKHSQSFIVTFVLALFVAVTNAAPRRNLLPRQLAVLGLNDPNPCQLSLSSAAMVSPTDGWAVGEGGIILHWNGSVWSQVTSPITGWLLSVAMVSTTDGWAVGEGGVILHWNGSTWSSAPVSLAAKAASPLTSSLHSVDMTSASDGWIVGEAGIILHWNGNTWMQVVGPTLSDLKSVAHGVGHGRLGSGRGRYPALGWQ
ncbi:MAG: hypothetical protein IPO15_18825 [Anaerolineae bacterium]|uniref:WD40/YVTN/BNR-like repeat-containing protein n=1 Tax=Candidatus Amarolinea dominans TaxID=3140696 RepID=UPI00313587D6|nr:hypothetical protein [Anaerolineae bacterium]